MRFTRLNAFVGVACLWGAVQLTGCGDDPPPTEPPANEDEETEFFRTREDIYNVRRCPELKETEALRFNAGFTSEKNRTAMNRTFNKSGAEDTMAHSGEEQLVSGRFWSGRLNLPGDGGGPAGETVHSFRQNDAGAWERFLTTTTTVGGVFEGTVPAEESFDVGAHRVLSVLEADGTCVEHGVFIFDEGHDAILSDIDATLTTDDAEMLDQMFNNLEHIPPKLEDADRLCQAWDEKGYLMLYLTARPQDFLSWTRIWLREEGFPLGPVETADNLVLGETAALYKGAFVARVLEDLGWAIHFGYGNAKSDVEGYTQGGLPIELIYTVNQAAEDGGYMGSTPLPNSYTTHIETVVADYPDAD